jgi:hypothetical protein
VAGTVGVAGHSTTQKIITTHYCIVNKKKIPRTHFCLFLLNVGTGNSRGMHRILFLPDIWPAGYPANPKATWLDKFYSNIK